MLTAAARIAIYGPASALLFYGVMFGPDADVRRMFAAAGLGLGVAWLLTAWRDWFLGGSGS